MDVQPLLGRLIHGLQLCFTDGEVKGKRPDIYIFVHLNTLPSSQILISQFSTTQSDTRSSATLHHHHVRVTDPGYSSHRGQDGTPSCRGQHFHDASWDSSFQTADIQ